MRLRHYFFIFTLLFSVFTFSAFAMSSPVTLVENVSSQMLSELKADKVTLKNNPNKVFDIVDRILLPHADMTTMAKNVVGRDAWVSASAADQQKFIREFTQLLIRTYASALASYSDQTIKVYPIRGGWEGQSQVEVQSEILQSEGPAIPVSYRLLVEGQQWKLVDMSVDKVSIVENYRAQFASDLSQGGLANLDVKLAQHNARLAEQG